MGGVYYFSGPPGSGKTQLTLLLEKFGPFRIDELPDPFPYEELSSPRSIKTAQYILEQVKKRDKLIREYKHKTLVIDRHPLDNLTVAKGLLANNKSFLEIKQQYLEYNFLQGKVFKINTPTDILHGRLLERKSKLVDKQMWLDILNAYETGDSYFSPDYALDGEKTLVDLAQEVLRIIRS